MFAAAAGVDAFCVEEAADALLSAAAWDAAAAMTAAPNGLAVLGFTAAAAPKPASALDIRPPAADPAAEFEEGFAAVEEEAAC